MIPNLTIRDLQDSDWDEVAAMMNLHRELGMTGDFLRERNHQWDASDPRLMVVGTDEDGKIVAYARSARRASDPEGKFHTSLCVHPKMEGQGLGRQLYEGNESFAREHGGTHLSVIV